MRKDIETIKIVVYTSNLKSLIKVLDIYNIKYSENEIKRNTRIFKIEKFINRKRENIAYRFNNMIKSSDIGPDIWVFEFQENYLYIYNNYKWHKKRIDILNYEELKREEECYSLYDVNETIFLEELKKYKDDKLIAKKLIQLKNSILYKSIINYLSLYYFQRRIHRSRILKANSANKRYQFRLVINNLEKIEDDIELYKNIKYEILKKII